MFFRVFNRGGYPRAKSHYDLTVNFNKMIDLYDLKMWIRFYEGVAWGIHGVLLICVLGQSELYKQFQRTLIATSPR